MRVMCAGKTKLLGLVALPSLVSCVSSAFPHIGTVDTRPHAPGTIHAQVSAGAGVGLFIPNAGASIAADTFLSPRLSLATSAHVLGSIDEHIMPGARLGFRVRANPRLSLGAGATINTGALLIQSPKPSQRFAAGFDVELATSRPRPKGRFASHAWRFAYAGIPGVETTPSIVGDWSRSRPTSNPRLRLSYGINYGVTMRTTHESQGAPENPPEETPVSSPSIGYATGPVEGPVPFLGFHLGLQFGTPRITGNP